MIWRIHRRFDNRKAPDSHRNNGILLTMFTGSSDSSSSRFTRWLGAAAATASKATKMLQLIPFIVFLQQSSSIIPENERKNPNSIAINLDLISAIECTRLGVQKVLKICQQLGGAPTYPTQLKSAFAVLGRREKHKFRGRLQQSSHECLSEVEWG
jgi:hypothetical protein